MVKVVNFVLCVFYHNLKIVKGNSPCLPFPCLQCPLPPHHSCPSSRACLRSHQWLWARMLANPVHGGDIFKGHFLLP